MLQQIPDWFQSLSSSIEVQNAYIACLAIKTFNGVLMEFRDVQKNTNFFSLVMRKTDYPKLAAKRVSS